MRRDSDRFAEAIDGAAREFEFTSKAATFDDDKVITDVADRLGWLTVSIANDWSQVFPDA